jgi:microsomal epoxide hydrolase
MDKFHTWSDCKGDPESVFTKDELLTNIMLYWVTGAIGSSFWPYYARMHGPWPIPEGSKISVPTGYARFPAEILRPPRSVAEKVYNISAGKKMDQGGHFAALEQPEALVREVTEFFRPPADRAAALAGNVPKLNRLTDPQWGRLRCTRGKVLPGSVARGS